MLRDLSWLKRVKIIDKDGNFIDSNNPFPTVLNYFFRVTWTSLIDFGKGSLTNVEIKDVNDEAYLQLEEKEDNSENIPFTTPSNYNYDTDEIEFNDGKAQLKSSITEEQSWPFTTPANYVYDTDKITVADGIAKLKGTFITPYAWYHLNSLSGTTAIDASGHGRNGLTVNSPLWVAGKLNNCLQMNGSNQTVNCGDIAGFDKTDSFSVEAWIKTTKTTAQTLVSKMQWASPYRGWRVFTVTDKVYFDLYGGDGGGLLSVYSSVTVSDNNWHHIIVTYDGSNTPAGVKIYVDGILRGLSVSTNNLTISVLTPALCYIGSRDGLGDRFLGLIDEVVIYDRILAQDEVNYRYNSGTGREGLLGAYPTDNPSIVPVSGFVFTSRITEFSESIITSENTAIKYHVSADDGVTWKYWNGSAWVVTDGSYNQSNIATTIHTNINTLATSGIFKVRALLHTDDDFQTPQLDSLYIGVATYPINGKELEMNWDIQPTNNFEYLSVTETVIEPSDTDIKYQYSLDSGSSYNGSWLSASELQTVLQEISCVGDGTDKIRFKFLLFTTSPIRTPEIDNLNLLSDSGYEFSGEFESNIYNSGYYSLDWLETCWQIELPSGCNIIIRTRASNDNGIMGDYGGALINGEDLPITGKYVQWKAEFTGNGRTTPKLQEFDINYAYPGRTEYRA